MNEKQNDTALKKENRRFQAVCAMLKGEPLAHIIETHNICRSDLYKFRNRALCAMQKALHDMPRGPKIPHNRTAQPQEKLIVQLFKRNPTMSSYKINKKTGAHCPRTIQRVRKRHGLERLPKRAPARSQAKRFRQDIKGCIEQFMITNSHLGALRLSWDIAAIIKISISASTLLRWKNALTPKPAIKVIHWRFYERHHPHSLWHGDLMKFEQNPLLNYQVRQLTLLDDYSRAYIFCELTTQNTAAYTIICLIKAMRYWRVIPKAILFDNGSEFRGNLLHAFCKQLGIQIIYAAPHHPQTNGKLERAFRDDKRDFYARHRGYALPALQQELPGYIYYRNYQRGHYALKGKPSVTRFSEQDRYALPAALQHLEDYAVHEIDPRAVNTAGYIHLFNRLLYVGKEFQGASVRCFETIDGLILKKNDQTIGILPDYYGYKSLCNRFCHQEIPQRLILHNCPRIAVAN